MFTSKSIFHNPFEDKVTKILHNVNNDISLAATHDINKVNVVTIKEALDKIKPNKSDPTWDCSSDFFKNPPSKLLDKTNVF